MHTEADQVCDIKSGQCSATDTMETSIGNEREWATRCLRYLKREHNLEVRHMTTDPDTRAFKAAEDLHSSKIT